VLCSGASGAYRFMVGACYTLDLDMPSLWPPTRDSNPPPENAAAPRAVRRTARGTEPPAGASAEELELRELVDAADYRKALERLMDLYGTAIYRHCRLSLGDDDLARDVHQEVFVQAFQGLPRFRGGSTLRTWLYAIAHHRCLDAIKHRRRFRGRFESHAEMPEVGVVPAAAEATSAGDRAKLGQALVGCLDGLAPAARLAVLQRHHEELSYDEMAGFSGERVESLRVRVFRAMAALRTCLEKQGVAP